MGKNLFQYGERFFGSFFPKTVVLLHVVFHTRSIAYDAGTDERHIMEMASLGDCRRFHIYGQTFGKVLFDCFEFFLVGYELISAAYQAAVYAVIARNGSFYFLQ